MVLATYFYFLIFLLNVYGKRKAVAQEKEQRLSNAHNNIYRISHHALKLLYLTKTAQNGYFSKTWLFNSASVHQMVRSSL